MTVTAGRQKGRESQAERTLDTPAAPATMRMSECTIHCSGTSGVYGGSSLWMQAPDGVDMIATAMRLRDQSVLIEPGAPFFRGTTKPKNYYRLAYSSIPDNRIDEGVAKIAQAIRSA